jgi:hypothetical protein
MPDQFRQLPIKRQSLVTSPESIEQLQELYRAHSSSTSDVSTYDYHSRRKFYIKSNNYSLRRNSFI